MASLSHFHRILIITYLLKVQFLVLIASTINIYGALLQYHEYYVP